MKCKVKEILHAMVNCLASSKNNNVNQYVLHVGNHVYNYYKNVDYEFKVTEIFIIYIYINKLMCLK